MRGLGDTRKLDIFINAVQMMASWAKTNRRNVKVVQISAGVGRAADYLRCRHISMRLKMRGTQITNQGRIYVGKITFCPESGQLNVRLNPEISIRRSDFRDCLAYFFFRLIGAPGSGKTNPHTQNRNRRSGRCPVTGDNLTKT